MERRRGFRENQEGKEMRGKKVVTIIPEIRQARINSEPDAFAPKRKVAGYARVSTSEEEQQNSYQSQLDYYTQYIKGRSDWEFVGMYSDEGITGTSTKKREGFKRMIDDALSGKIDLIITKSVSRFARNTVDSLTAVRQLKEKGIEVYFEKENIWTLDSKGELLITIMSSLAQEESRSISENTTWGQRKRMADGHGCIPFSNFLGYDRGFNGEFVINENQASIVKRIFTEYLDGNNASQIARGLTADKIKTVTGKDKWDKSSILSILQNEKYKGDCLMQKYYTENFLTKKQIKNRGELQQYYVKNHHDPIVSEEMFEAVQLKIRANAKRKRESGARDFSSKVFCGDCGSAYGSKVWHSNDKYRKFIYRCNRKYEGEKCQTPSIDERKLESLFVQGINKLLENKTEVIENMEMLLTIVSDNEQFENELQASIARLDKAEKSYKEIIDKQKKKPDDVEIYENLINIAEIEYNEARDTYEKLLNESKLGMKRVQDLEKFLNALKGSPDIVLEYDSNLMKRTLKKITVYNEGYADMEFVGDQVIRVEI